MIGKILFTLGVILVVALIWRTRAPRRAIGGPPSRVINLPSEGRWPLKGIALGVVALMLITSAYLLYQHWRDSNEIIFIRVVDAREAKEAEFHFKDGLAEYARYLAGGAALLHRDVIRLRAADELSEFPLERIDWSDQLAALVERMSTGTSTLEYDRLIPETGEHSHDAVVRLAELAEQAQQEILILNAYIIPGEQMMEILRDAVERGVRVRMLTNSLVLI